MKTHEIMERELNLLRINHTSLQYKLAAIEEEAKHSMIERKLSILASFPGVPSTPGNEANPNPMYVYVIGTY